MRGRPAHHRAGTLLPLVQAGHFEPGENAISCLCGGELYYADLGPSGEIFYEGTTFKSPSAFSVHIKRKINPERKADDGWTSCKYVKTGQLLSIYRPLLEELTGTTRDRPAPRPAKPLQPSLTGEPALGGKRKRQPLPRGTFDSESERDESRLTGGRSISPAPRRSSSGDQAEQDEDWTSGPRRPVAKKRAQASVVPSTAPGLSTMPEEDDPAAFTWIQCEEKECQKWRKIAVEDVPSDQAERWTCSMHLDPRQNECAKPQLVSDTAINRLLDVGEEEKHMQRCSRPPLDQCSEAQFEADLYSFLTQRGEGDLAKQLRNKRVTCNSTPIDIFGLYREVIRTGGFVDNEQYDGNRWKGGINFAGQIFPRMKNFTPNNRATSVGNQLLTNYRKFLLAYEEAHRQKDILQQTPRRPQEAPRKRGGSALDVLANLAGEKVADSPEGRKRTRAQPARGAAVVKEEPRSPAYRASVRAKQQVALELKKAQASRATPGSLLLAQDPADPVRHWPVIVASIDDLPQSVCDGGITGQLSGSCLPRPLQEASPERRFDTVYPVCVFGTEALGWVEAGACRPYSRVRADSAMTALLPDDSPGPSGREGGGVLDAKCARCLRLARQFNLSYEPDASAQGLAAAAGLRVAADRLGGIEARLPAAGATLSDNFAFWHTWRRSVRRAESAAELVPLVLALGQQLRPEILVPGAQGAVMNELHALLDLQPPEPQEGLAMHGQLGPTVLRVDGAISEVEAAIDWAAIARAWPSAPGPGAGVEGVTDARRDGHSELTTHGAEGPASSDFTDGRAAASRGSDGRPRANGVLRGGSAAEEDGLSGQQHSGPAKQELLDRLDAIVAEEAGASPVVGDLQELESLPEDNLEYGPQLSATEAWRAAERLLAQGKGDENTSGGHEIPGLGRESPVEGDIILDAGLVDALHALGAA